MCRRGGALLLVGACVLAFAGCKVDTQVDVTVRDDGSGTVTGHVALDADAVSRIATRLPLEQAVPLADLARAGWRVGPWTRTADGGATLRLRHEYAGERELGARLAELVGRDGVLRDPRLVRDRGWFTSRDEISVVADLRAPSVGVLADRDLAARLRAAGLDVAALHARLQGELHDALRLRVTLEAPGGHVTQIELAPGQTETVAVGVSRTDTNRLTELVIGGLLALLALLLALAARAGARRERARLRRRGAVAGRRVPLM